MDDDTVELTPEADAIAQGLQLVAGAQYRLAKEIRRQNDYTEIMFRLAVVCLAGYAVYRLTRGMRVGMLCSDG